MKPIKLTIEGINSFTDEQTLDFDAVGRDNLFCISGKTGAGKTTVFDSMLLALYGRCGRGNLGDVINLSRNDARITFEFESGGDVYLIERKIVRTRKKDAAKADKAETVEAVSTDAAQAESSEVDETPESGEKQESGDKKPDKPAVPLSTGTGKCKLYKNGEPFEVGNETAALSDIVGLTLEEFKNVYLLEQGEYAEFLKLTPQKQLETVGKIFSLRRFADVFSLAHGEQLQAEKEIDIRDAQIESIGKDSAAELKAVKAELAQLRAKNTALDKDISRIRGELDEESRRRDVYNSAMEKARNVKRLALALDDAKRELSAAESACAEFSGGDRAEKLAIELRERETELIKLGALDAEHARLVSEEKTKLELYDKKRVEADALDGEYKDRQAETVEIEKSLGEIIAQFCDIAEAVENRSPALTSALGGFAANGRTATVSEISEIGYALKTELNEYKATAASRDGEARACDGYAGECADTLKKIESYNAARAEATAKRESAESAERAAQERLTRAQTEAHAAAVRSELHVGDKCPVCGGVYNGETCGEHGDVDTAKREHLESKRALDTAVAEENKLVRATDDAKAAYGRCDAERKQREARVAELDEKLRASGVEPGTHDKLLNVLRTAHERAEKLEKAREKINALLPNAAKLAAERDGAKSAADECAQRAATITKELGEMLGKTAELIASTRKAREQAELEVKEYNDKKAALTAKYEGEKAKVKTFESELTAAQKDCPVDMPEFDEEKYAEKKAQFDGMTSEFNARETEIAVKNSNAEMLAAKCEDIKKITAERAELVKRYDVYKKIAELTKGKALLNFVAEEYVYDFTAAASETLGELSGGKYSMSFDSANGFLVYDYLNDGKPRKASTLSGGEMFLASLAVAIAIADAQSKGDNAFFFLDEGFGTLDEELIDTVFGALSQLSAHCLVGVITHAGALIERMPCTVEVLEATDTVGSRIKQ